MMDNKYVIVTGQDNNLKLRAYGVQEFVRDLGSESVFSSDISATKGSLLISVFKTSKLGGDINLIIRSDLVEITKIPEKYEKELKKFIGGDFRAPLESVTFIPGVNPNVVHLDFDLNKLEYLDKRVKNPKVEEYFQ